MVKHTINHKYKFRAYGIVALVGFMQFVIAFSCELLNYMYIITTNDPINIVGQFVAFYIIADLDTIYYKILAPTSIKAQLDEEMAKILTEVHCTTSIDAR